MGKFDRAGLYGGWALLALGLPLWAHDDLVVPIKPRLELSVDYRHYDRRNLRPSGPTLDCARLGFEVQAAPRLRLSALGDARGVDSHGGLAELDLSYEGGGQPLPWRASAGLLTIVTGVEQETARTLLPGIEYGFPAFIAGYRAWGAKLEGEYGDGLIYARLGASGAEGFDLLGQRRGEPAGHLKLTSYPMRGGPRALEGFFLSGALLRSQDFEGHLDVASEMRNKLFHTPRLRADTFQARHLGYGLDAGRLRFTHEFVRASLLNLELPGGGRRDLDNQITAWSAGLSWRIHGPPYDGRTFRRPAPPVLQDDSLARGGWGQWELGLRYANADIDRDFILLGFTRYDESAQEFRSFSAALTWRPIDRVRWRLHVGRILADQHPAQIAFTGRDTSALLGLEISF